MTLSNYMAQGSVKWTKQQWGRWSTPASIIVISTVISHNISTDSCREGEREREFWLAEEDGQLQDGLN